jgi:hypothetical protein
MGRQLIIDYSKSTKERTIQFLLNLLFLRSEFSRLRKIQIQTFKKPSSYAESLHSLPVSWGR